MGLIFGARSNFRRLRLLLSFHLQIQDLVPAKYKGSHSMALHAGLSSASPAAAAEPEQAGAKQEQERPGCGHAAQHHSAARQREGVCAGRP